MRPNGSPLIVYALVALVALCAPAALWPQAGTVPPDEAPSLAAWSLGIQAGTVIEAFWYGEEAFPYVLLGTATAQHLPAILHGAGNAWANAGAQLGLDAAFIVDRLASDGGPLGPVLFNAAHKFSMFAVYDAYAELRTRAADPAYAGGLERSSFADLALAPFDPANYSAWPVWGYLGSMGLVAALSMAGAPDGQAVWDTGSAWLGDREYSPLLGVTLALALQVPNFIMTGVGEEALYRGVVYEELSTRLGEWPGKIADALYFTGSHLPQQWSRIKEMGAWRFLAKTLLSMGQSFWFQYIYEWQGLEAAVTAHAVSDVIIFFCDWLSYGGMPNEHGFSINERGGLSIGFDL